MTTTFNPALIKLRFIAYFGFYSGARGVQMRKEDT